MEYYPEGRNDLRFDFVIEDMKSDYSMVVEAKSLKENLKTYHNTMFKYIQANSSIPWGILTNGLEWHFFVSRQFMEERLGEGKKLPGYIEKKVFNVLNLRLEDQHFLSIMSSMAKEKLKDFWYAVR